MAGAAETGRSRQIASSSQDLRVSENILCILRIGRALLVGFIKTLCQRYAACPHPIASLEQPGRVESTEQSNGEDVPDHAQMHSLQECLLRIWQELSNNAEITSMTESVVDDKPLRVLASVAEQMFATGINWGRIVVFFYFAYRVISQTAFDSFDIVIDWAMDFLRDRLAAWIQEQGGWIAMLNVSSRE